MGSYRNIGLVTRSTIALCAAAATLVGSAFIGVPNAHAVDETAKPSVIINEVFAGNTKELGDPVIERDDWVELKNTGSEPVNVKGWGIYDEKQKKHYTIGVDKEINTDTIVQPGGYLVAEIDYNGEPGLGSDADSVYLTSKTGDKYDTAAEVDSTMWKLADKLTAQQSWSRADDGTFKVSDKPTPGAANEFPSPTPTPEPGEKLTVNAWPGLDKVTPVDAKGEFGASGKSGEHTDGNLSGLVYENATNTLWAADNDLNPTLGNTEDKGPGSINKFVLDSATGTWKQDTTDGWTFKVDDTTKGGKQLHFKDGKGGVDSEGITLINGDSSKGVFIGAERDNEDKNTPRPSILSYDVQAAATDTNGDGAQDLTATHEWNLVDPLSQFGVTLTKDDANLGVEGLAFIPNETLTANKFKVNLDPNKVHDYNPAGAANDYDGLFFAALEKTNAIYAFALATVGGKDVAYPISQIPLPQAAANAGFDGPRDLTWDAEHNQLLAQGDNDKGTGSKIATYTFDKNGALTLTTLTATPAEIAGQNSEGYAITSDSAAKSVEGGKEGKTYKPVFWADDGVTDGYSLRQGWIETSVPAKTSTEINLLNFNDFHGRIDKNLTVPFAGTIEQLRAEYPNSSLLLSAGDNIGASLFNSSVQRDQPTIDVLNALGVKASAVGNHEFDQGYADLTDRVIGADGKRNAQWDYLGANVYRKSDGKPALKEYSIQDVNGVKVGVIGAVTQETSTLVSPGGIKDITFGDPVEAVNRVAKQLTDGNESNGEADVIVAEYHEGALANEDTETGKPTLDEQKADSPVFKHIVDDTDKNVDVIFTAHTHMAYDYADPAHANRPIIQTGSYAANVGQVVLDYDKASDKVTYVKSGNVPSLSAPAADPDKGATDEEKDAFDAELAAKYPTVAKVKEIVDAALKVADAKGNEKVGSIAADITTAFKDGARDDRASESTMGNLVADALLDSLKSADRGGAEIGVVNPGGLRAEFCKTGENEKCTLAADGSITYAQANAVLPFLNNLWTTTLTGAQFKEALEQQWQTTADGKVPSRPYLQLGLSHNVSYTYDPNAKQGEHITSVTVNGEPLDPSREYRIGSFSFLLQGGDNFRAFAAGKDTKDTGLVDRDAWIDYIRANSPLKPRYDRRAVAVTGLPTGEVKAGSSFALNFSKLTLTSLGVPAETKLTAKVGDATVGVADVKDGDSSTLTVTLPRTLAAGNATLTIVGATNGTTVTLPLTVAAADSVTPSPKPQPKPQPGPETPQKQPQQPQQTGDKNKKPSADKNDKAKQLTETGSSVAWIALVAAVLLVAGGISLASIGIHRREE